MLARTRHVMSKTKLIKVNTRVAMPRGVAAAAEPKAVEVRAAAARAMDRM